MKTKNSHRRYRDFADQIDVDRLIEALDLRSAGESGDELYFHCFDAYGLHKHGDRTGKLAINRQKKLAGCWICGGWNLVSLVMAIYDWDPQTSVNWLYQFTSEESEDQNQFLAEVDKVLDPPQAKAEVLPYFNEHILQRWLTLHKWFDNRCIAKFCCDLYRLGFDPQHMRHSPMGDDPYYGPAIILPHFWHGQLVGWQARWLAEDRPKWVPKYTATPDMPTKTTLWNWDNCTSRPIVVESVPTALFLLSEGYEAIATFGSSVSEDQIKLLRVFQQGVLLAPDYDRAGEKWFKALSKGLEPFVPVGAIGPVGSEGGDLGDLTPAELHQHIAEQQIWL